MSKVLAVVNAWLNPRGKGGGEETTRIDLSVTRGLPDSVRRGEPFEVTVRFYIPWPYQLNSMGVSDVAPDFPEAWEVTVDEAWSSPDSDHEKATDNKAEIAWYGPYGSRWMYARYRVTVPDGGSPGMYPAYFGDGWLEYYIGGEGPFIVEIEGDDMVWVS